MSRGRDFWSDRRAAVQAEEKAAETAARARAAAVEQAELDARDDADILAELDLPDPDHLQPGDDIRGFMAKAVPDRLRRRALRQLWRLNPVLANVDGLVDYGEDFTDSATVIENLQTAYQVGKGMLAHVEELARQAAAAETPPPAAEPEPDVPVALTIAPEPAASERSTAETTQHELSPDAVPEHSDAPLPPQPRRMRFAFTPDNRNA